MTPKELLKEIKARHESLYDRYYNTEKYHFNENNKFLYDDLEKALNELEALKPPTVEEVCALIEKDIKGKATYSCGQFYIDNEKVDDLLFGVFRAKTLIAIGKFYEELEK